MMRLRIITTCVFIGVIVLFTVSCTNVLQNQGEIQRHYETGARLVAEGKFNEAILEYKQILAKDRSEEKAYLDLGEIYRKKGRFQDEQKVYEDAIRNGIMSNETMYARLGIIFRRNHDDEQALDAYQTLVDLNPDHFDAHRWLAYLYEKQGRLDDAVTHYRHAVRINPEQDCCLYVYLGDVLVKLHQPDEAIDSYRQALEVSPNNYAAHTNLANALRSQGQLNKAITHYRKAIEIRPQDFCAYNGLGNTLGAQGKFEEAVETYRKASELSPNHSFPYINLGVAFFRQGKYAEAMKYYRKALELDPNNPLIHNNIGDVFFQTNQLEAALKSYRKACELNDKSAPAYLGIANVLHRQDRDEEAIESLRRARDVNPMNANTYLGIGWFLLQQRQYDKAIANYRRAIELAPLNFYGYVFLGAGLLKQGHMNAAIDTYRKALEFTPHDVNGKMELVQVYAFVGDEAQALALSRELLTHQHIGVAKRFGIRFVAILALLIRQNRADTIHEVEQLLDERTSLTKDYPRTWNYSDSQCFITMSDKISALDKTFLLALIDFLETPKAQEKNKLQTLRAQLSKFE